MHKHRSAFEIITGTGAVFLSLVFLCVSLEAGRIERGLADRAAGILNESGLYWFAVEPQGRDLVVTGAVSDRAAVDDVRARMAQLAGVRRSHVDLQSVGTSGVCQQRIEATLQEHPLTFKVGHAELADASHAGIGKLASELRSCAVRFEVAVHAGPQGSAAVGLALSQRRADLIARRLAESGVAGEAIVATGYGVRQPVGGAPMFRSQRSGQRVELRVLGAQT